MAMLQNSTRGFGLVNVSGRRRVPKPPTRISAFIGMVEAGEVTGSVQAWGAVTPKRGTHDAHRTGTQLATAAMGLGTH